MEMEFDMPKGNSSIIKVIGVGGGGSNAVNHMFIQGFTGVDFVVCNTDKQALDASPVPHKIQLGASLTEGRGAGTIPEIGMNAAIENLDEIKEVLGNNTKMVFVTAGMGGGTGTGAAPVIAKTAKDMGILTVGIVTIPFNFEGRKRRQQAEQGLENMRQSVDTLLVINNERLREIFGNLSLGNAFSQADDILSTAAKGIADVISVTGAINVDFNDVNTVMKDSGVAVMGSAVATGENRAIEAVKTALSSPLLNDNDIEGAEYVLLNITYGDIEVLMDEISDITDYIQDEAGSTADVIWGHGYDETLGDALSVTIIATGFQKNQSPVTGFEREPEKKVQVLDVTPKEITTPLTQAIADNTSKAPEPYLKSNQEVKNEEVNYFSKEDEFTSFNENQNELIEDKGSVTMDWEVKTVENKEEEPQQQFDLFNEPIIEEEVVKHSLEDEMEVDNWVRPFDTENSTNEDSVNEPIFTPENVVNDTIDTPQFTEEPVQEKIVHLLQEDNKQEIESTFETEDKQSTELTKDEIQRRNEERMERIRQYTSHLNTAEGINELEKQPAYLRRNIKLDDVDHSSDANTSRFEVIKDNNNTTLRGTNSFLHDNVD